LSARNRQNLRSLGLAFISVVILTMTMGLVFSCGGGGEEAIVPPPEELATDQGKASNRPIIAAITPRVTGAGQTVTITGLYFGDEEESGSVVTIGGRRFDIVSWSDTTIEAVVPVSAESGIVVVTVGTLSSQSGTNAQLFIGEAPPTGEPLIVCLSHDTASVGSRMTVYGFNFGAARNDSSVTFTRKDGARIPAAIVTEYVNGEPRELWSDTSIQVIVPAGEPDIPIVSGPVIVTVNGMDSNSNFLFNPLPVPPGSDAPLISAVSPESGPAGTGVTITGVNFGYSRGVSVVTIGGLQLQVITWSDTEIVAVIPQGATTNLIRVLVGGLPAESPHAFVVDAVPFLSAVIPDVLEVGQSMQIYGRDFGTDVGSVTLAPPAGASGQGSTTVSGGSITSWSNTAITIDRLPSLNSDAGVPLEITVRTGGSAPQVSVNSIIVNVYSPVQVAVGVDYAAGVAHETSFGFSVGVGGGSSPYSVLIEYGDGSTGTNEAVVSTTSFNHTYSAAGDFTVAVRATDANGSRTSITGPSITVVAVGEPVIRDINIIGLDTSPTPANFRPNEEVGEYFGHYLGNVYNFDESFIPILDAVGLGDMETFAKRQWPLYTLEGRPYAYRVGGGSLVQIAGFNLLAGQPAGSHGHILQLNYNPAIGSPYQIGVGSPEYASWTDTFIQFRTPDTSQAIGGDVGIVFDAASGKDPIVSPTRLVAAPVLFDYVPKPPAMNSTITINFNDGTPPQVADYIGTKAYLFWTFPAQIDGGGAWNYDRDGDGDNDNYLLPGGVPITILPGQTFLEFDLNTIYRDGSALYAARDPAPGDPGTVGVTPAPGNWAVYMWVGSKSSPFAESFANSGIISNELTIQGVTAP